MHIDLFDFSLPPSLIAQKPVFPRDSAKLLHITAGNTDMSDNMRLSDRCVRDLPDLLKSGDLLILNDTKVIPAELYGRRNSGAKIKFNLHLRANLSEKSPNLAEKTVMWYAFAKPAKRLKQGEAITILAKNNGVHDILHAKIIHIGNFGEVLIAFYINNTPCDEAEFEKILPNYGNMPLPPYIKRDDQQDNNDGVDYQTIFAKNAGAVAAPTAGLHFTDDLFSRLKKNSVRTKFVTLHVGAGTFLPVKCENIHDHQMHSEYGELSQNTCDAINETRQNGGRIVCVGTTSLRILESVASRQSLKKDGLLAPFKGETDIFITPGFDFKIADILLTNFHLPKSTLFMLVSAFKGLNDMQMAYQHAISNGYRFFSYGDACLIEK